MDLITIAYGIIPLIFAITVHEVGHAFVAKKFGDYTAYSQGRITLNPINHIDPIGTLLVPIVSLLTTGFMFGWAKPVPVNFSKLRNPRRDTIWVALAGPMANLLMALIWAILYALDIKILHTGVLGPIGRIGVIINISFMLFNLFPILPLDGGRILQSLLPVRLAWKFSKTERYGIWIVLLLSFTGVIGSFLTPMSRFFYNIMI